MTSYEQGRFMAHIELINELAQELKHDAANEAAFVVEGTEPIPAPIVDLVNQLADNADQLNRWFGNYINGTFEG